MTKRKETTAGCKTGDLAGSIRSLVMVWGLPIAAIVAGFFLPGTPRSLLWFAGTLITGAACFINAGRCGRLHCYFTGPFFLATAVVVALLHFGVLSLSPTGWWLFGLGILSGGLILFVVPEFLWGRYRRKQAGVELQSTITCPHCGFSKEEVMPVDACQYFYKCTNCEKTLKPKTGDCCVFCSYGSQKCPPKQSAAC